MQTLADKFMKVQKHSIYATYHTLVEMNGVHKIVAPNGTINFIFSDGSVVQTDTSLYYMQALERRI